MAISRLWDWLGLLLIVAIVFVLLRPGSNAPQLIQALANMIAAIIKAATDLAHT